MATLTGIWNDFAKLLEKANGLGEFRAERLVRMIEVAGGVAGNNPTYNDLVEKTGPCCNTLLNCSWLSGTNTGYSKVAMPCLTDKISKIFPDLRDQGKITHSLKSMLQQRIYGLACGYEDCNDHDSLRHDIALQTATDRSSSLASSPTLNRFENVSDRGFAVSSTKAMVEIFIESYKTPPKELIPIYINNYTKIRRIFFV